jgi:hypothetical protein
VTRPCGSAADKCDTRSQCAARRRHLPGGVKGPAAGLSQHAGRSWGQLGRGDARFGRQAALTTPGRIGTARRCGFGKRDEKVYVRNQW